MVVGDVFLCALPLGLVVAWTSLVGRNELPPLQCRMSVIAVVVRHGDDRAVPDRGAGGRLEGNGSC